MLFILTMNRVIVIGASAGGTEVLLNLVGELPASLPAAIFIVLHTVPDFLGPLPELLENRGNLPARHAVHTEKIRAGQILVAPSDNHLQLRHGYVEVVRGPKENGHRPAVDALFRTASWSYGPRVIGVILSGHQDCGTAGMMSVKARGGLTVVQSPETAIAPDMPQSVIERMQVDYVVHPVELPGLLTRLANQPVKSEEGGTLSLELQQLEGARPGEPAELVCPTCQGVLTEARAGEFEHFRCHVGHAFTLSSLAREQNEGVERALWAGVRALEESAALSRRLSLTERNEQARDRFAEKAATLTDQANIVRSVLLNGHRVVLPEPPETDQAAEADQTN